MDSRDIDAKLKHIVRLSDEIERLKAVQSILSRAIKEMTRQNGNVERLLREAEGEAHFLRRKPLGAELHYDA